MTEHWDDESVLRDRLTMLSRQKWIVLAAVFVTPLIAFGIASGQQHLYQASATVLVDEQNPTAAALNLSTGTGSPPDRYLATQAALARVGTVVQMALKAAGMPARSAGALYANSSVSANPSADLLTFSVTDPRTSIAERLATAYATQFTVYRHQLDTAALSQAISDARRRLNAIQASGDAGSPLFQSLTTSYRDLEALQTLQAAGSSAVVVGPAGGSTLVQPKTKRDVLLGLIAGLALGIGLAFLREALDTRVHSADELRARLGLPLLGQVPKPDRRPGASQQLATLSEPTGSSAEAFRILKTSLDISQLQQHVGSVVITSAVQGEGKSTTAANLAVILAQSGRRVILVDLDLRRPGIGRLFDLADRPGLTNVAVGELRLVDALILVDVHGDTPVPAAVKPRAMIAEKAPTTTAGRPLATATVKPRTTTAGKPAAPTAGKLEVLTVGPPPPDPGAFLAAKFVPDTLTALTRRCDVLLIDTPPLLAVGDAMAIATRADALILVAGLRHVRREALAETRRVLDASPALKLGFIATGSTTDVPYPYRYATRAGAPTND